MHPGLMATLFPRDDFSLMGIILGMPLLGALVNGIWGKRLGKPAVRVMGVATVVVSFVAAVVTFIVLDGRIDATAHTEAGKMVHDHVRLTWTVWHWMHTNGGPGATDVPVEVKFSVDALSSVMMLIITGIGSLIHLYSTAYMAEDKAFWRFFSYLNLFIFSMLVLVMADNLPLLFVGWEGVGLCSYLLIGFWYDHAPNAAAGKKAFIANRIGDFGLLCAMFLFAHYTGALDWAGIQNGATSLVEPPSDMMRIHIWPVGGGRYEGMFAFLQPHHPLTVSAATAVGLALLLGCTGKSAQIPLYTWLPDAMAGPTPVSALIHAATMVTAGIYLICRLSFVFVMSPFVMMLISIIGAGTALYAATIACVQNDIKKVLAYSTVSQLGYMFLGVGVGAFTAGFFHVLTHAFFKGCLFLCAGSVIHAMHARVHDHDASQDMRNMGGLRKYMPYTFWTYLVATAAIIGTPPFSGFFSKDEILYRSYVDQLSHPLMKQLERSHNTPFVPPAWIGPMVYWTGVLAAVLTAFYMCRSLFLTFYGDFRGWSIGRPSVLARAEAEADEEAHAHDDDAAAHEHHEDLTQPGYAPHESPWQMTVPLIVLATGAAFAGVLNAGLFHFTPLDHWLEPVFADATTGAVGVAHGRGGMEWTLMGGGLGAWAIGTGVAYYFYVMQKGAAEKEYLRLATRGVMAMSGILVAVLGVLAWLLINWAPGSTSKYVWSGGLVLLGAGMVWRYKSIGLDDAYDATAVAAVDALADTAASFDQWFVDGVLAKATSFIVAMLGTVLRAFQNGVVHAYAAIMVIGIAVVGWFFIWPHADATMASKGTDVVLSAGTAGGYLDYQYQWQQCEPDKKQWLEQWDKATKISDRTARADEEQKVTKDLRSEHAKCAAPGDRWTPVGPEAFGPTAQVTLHLEPDSDAVQETTRPVELRAHNVFSKVLHGLTASTTVYVPRAAKTLTLELGQN